MIQRDFNHLLAFKALLVDHHVSQAILYHAIVTMY